jgi:hypothetical protein
MTGWVAGLSDRAVEKTAGYERRQALTTERGFYAQRFCVGVIACVETDTPIRCTISAAQS